ncbi:hypothetical protein [Borrelia coriaceae]|uniref:hypothetical protein n=1 Tax=Borrelia coriaceae TaxID=144 RepID=UPI001FF6FA56|nr:hypothetical protein [Borrelia coriaceae]
MSRKIRDDDILKMWISITSLESLRMTCIREDGKLDIPQGLKLQLCECLRYSKSILKLYYIKGDAYNNWLFILLDVVYPEVFNSRCAKAGQQKDCKFRQVLDQLDLLFPRVDGGAFLSIG